MLNGALLFHYYFITNKSRHFSAIIYAELYILDFLCSGESLTHATPFLHEQWDLFIQYCVTIFTVYSPMNYEVVQLFNQPQLLHQHLCTVSYDSMHVSNPFSLGVLNHYVGPHLLTSIVVRSETLVYHRETNLCCVFAVCLLVLKQCV